MRARASVTRAHKPHIKATPLRFALSLTRATARSAPRPHRKVLPLRARACGAFALARRWLPQIARRARPSLAFHRSFLTRTLRGSGMSHDDMASFSGRVFSNPKMQAAASPRPRNFPHARGARRRAPVRPRFAPDSARRVRRSVTRTYESNVGICEGLVRIARLGLSSRLDCSARPTPARLSTQLTHVVDAVAVRTYPPCPACFRYPPGLNWSDRAFRRPSLRARGRGHSPRPSAHSIPPLLEQPSGGG